MKPFSSILTCAAIALALATSVKAGDNFRPADAKALAVRIVSEPEYYDHPMSIGGTVISARARCSTAVPRAIDVTLQWDVKQPDAKAVRIDLTEFRDGFAKGRFLTSGERRISERELLFESARPGLYYYWRVLADTGNGWVVRGAGRFEAPICPHDKMEDGE